MKGAGRRPQSDLSEPALRPEPAILMQLSRVLSSAQFNRSERLGRLLKFIVESGARGDVTGLKESVLGREVYDRGEEFDGRVDPIIRTEMRRLRRKLCEYYDAGGALDPVVIEIPKGGYVPRFRERDAARPRVAGESVGSYEVIERLGSGPSGPTYRVIEPQSGQQFAIKLLPPDLVADSRAISSLKEEVQSAVGLDHENVCGVQAIEQTTDGVFVRAPYCEGITLEDWLFSRQLVWRQAQSIGGQLLKGLAAAHAAGIAHGHLKISNVLLTEASEEMWGRPSACGGLSGRQFCGAEADPRVRILGFGTRSLAGRILLRPDGRQLGSHEQFHGSAGKLSDVRSAGAILWALFSGAFPKAPVCRRPEAFPWLPDVPKQYRPQLSGLILRAMGSDGATTFDDAVELAGAYEQVFEPSGSRFRREFLKRFVHRARDVVRALRHVIDRVFANRTPG
jgi:hypothetical protein